MLGLSKQGYYKYLKSTAHNNHIEQQICLLVRDIRRVMPRIGTRKLMVLLKPQLEQLNIKIGRDRLFDILRKHFLLISKRKKYQITTQSKHQFFKHPNRIKDLTIKAPEQVWVADITYIKTSQGFAYLHLITDAYSKQIMGYYLSDNMKMENAITALKMALKNKTYNHPLIHHSDRGFQYCHHDYTDMLQQHNISISMTTKYDPYENAIAERVNGILKDEFDIGEGFLNHLQAVKWVKESVEVYNQMRPHLSCGMLTPSIAHKTKQPLAKLWK
ncbi:IS3 family transposase [Ekhidna sp.]|uniref:IS3 family transposase n=1 Tax=Ekhidna sp. TaxID=2608089 RepID=UPI00329A7344